MKQPRDMEVANTVGLVKVARVFSNVVSPPVMFAVLGIAIGLHEIPSLIGFGWSAVYGLLVSLAPILFVLYMLQTGRIKELHMSNTSERHLPYIVAVACAALALLILWLFDGPSELQCLSVFNIVELASLGVINIFWLISIHATGIVATALIAGLKFGPTVGWLLVPLVILVCAARLFLKRHNIWQLLAGAALGVATVLPIASTGCFGG